MRKHKSRKVLDHASYQLNVGFVSDTRKACRSATPVHQTSMDKEQGCSVSDESNRGWGRLRCGDVSFQFLSFCLGETSDKRHSVLF